VSDTAVSARPPSTHFLFFCTDCRFDKSSNKNAVEIPVISLAAVAVSHPNQARGPILAGHGQIMLRRMVLQRPNVPEQLRMLLAPFFSFFNLHFNSSDAAWVTVFVLFCLVSPFETTLLPQTLIDSFSWTILAATLLHPV
jgi:hypothetical protein